MLAKYRGIIVFTLLCAVIGIALSFVWDGYTQSGEPPLWSIPVMTLLVLLIVDPLERAIDRRYARRKRSRVVGPRPTNPDGTPYGYHQIRAGGWSHCDGCRMWGQGWTADHPHRCAGTFVKGPAVKSTKPVRVRSTKTTREIGEQVARTVVRLKKERGL